MYLATRKESAASPFWLQQPAHLAFVAKQAMVAEAELTPKPGLVDRRGSGAHKDLSLTRMRQSAEAIEPFFASMAEAARKRSVNQLLRQEFGCHRARRRDSYVRCGAQMRIKVQSGCSASSWLLLVKATTIVQSTWVLERVL
jgi:triphosphoribosyl-dephospho-CoA synthetase